MRGIFRSETEPRRHQLRSQLLETDHANTAHAVTGIQLGFEWGRKTPPNYLGIDAVVQQHPSVDNAVDGVEEHKVWLVAQRQAQLLPGNRCAGRRHRK